MKKKLLALTLAAAVMVPSASAFAVTQSVGGHETNPVDANVTINGSVRASDGTASPGRIEVELPTAVSFTVDELGTFQTVPFTINNKSAKGIDVAVQSFIETNPSGGLTLVEDANLSTLKSADRSNINLKVSGNAGEVTLKHNMSVTDGAGTTIAKIAATTSDQLQLIGKVGEVVMDKTDTGAPEVDKTGLNEDFTLKFRITTTK